MPERVAESAQWSNAFMSEMEQPVKTVTDAGFDGVEMFNVIASARAAAGQATRRLTVA
jgi:hypothetical protein